MEFVPTLIGAVLIAAIGMTIGLAPFLAFRFLHRRSGSEGWLIASWFSVAVWALPVAWVTSAVTAEALGI